MINQYKLAVSVGEPAGIGPDALLMLYNDAEFIANNRHILIAFCDPQLLEQRAKLLNLQVKIAVIKSQDIPNLSFDIKYLYVVDTASKQSEYKPAELNPEYSEYVINSLHQATLSCIKQDCDALITCPINKNIINQAGIPFTGHTEFIADLCNQYNKTTRTAQNKPYQPIMLLMGRDYQSFNIKVALITTHLALNKIPAAITQELLIEKIRLINTELMTKFNITRPKILVTGLNPHAGENGSLGVEELETIIPAIRTLQNTYHLDINGPLAADSIFTADNIKNSDIIIAMYHDQGLTGFKARCFNHAANVTLGLPIIRTSVDHGTALSLTGTGNINIDSLKFAIHTAKLLIKNKTDHDNTLRSSAA